MTTSQSPTDRELAQAFLDARDERAFRDLYARHAPPMYGLLCRVVGVDDAQDVLQEAWLRCARRLASFRWESALRTWLTGIALNCARELLRGRSRATFDAVPEEPFLTPRVDAAIDLAQAVADLAEGYRLVLLLHDAQGYTHVEIAEMLEIDVGTSKSRLHRARRAAQEALASTAAKPRGQSHGR